VLTSRSLAAIVIASAFLAGCSGSLTAAVVHPVSGSGTAMQTLSYGSPFQYFAGPTENYAHQMAAGPDGNVWFRDTLGGKIGYITPTGSVTEFSLPPSNAVASGISAGADGNVWYTDGATSSIGRVTMTGTVTTFAVPSGAQPLDIASGADGNLWFTARAPSTGQWFVGRSTTGGAMTLFRVPDSNASLSGITLAIDGNIWFANAGSASIGRITPSGTITEFKTPSGIAPNGITPASDGALYSAIRGGSGGLLRTNMHGVMSEFVDPNNPHPFVVISEGPGHCVWGNRLCDDGIGQCFDLFNVRRQGFTEHRFPSAVAQLNGLVAGPDGNMWYQFTATAHSVSSGLGLYHPYI